ncbi:DUF6216 family protein [Luteibacter sp. CQ10]|uniref:DUF6216 family protein n=1 Tax=Luteibacter sp. CQ10 TaxID=2805821 RepID=UPI0034A3EF87
MDVSALGLSAPYASALTLALVIAPFIWVVARSRSLFMVRHRLWRLLHRRPENQEAWLDEAIRERFELMRFRALVMWADSLAEARRITAWASAQGIDVGVLGDCGKYFNRHKLALRERLPPLLKAKVATGVIRALLAGGIVIALAQGFDHRTLLRLRHDSSWLLATPTSAEPLWGGTGEVMTIDDCKAGRDPSGFGAENRAIVCRVLGAEGLQKFLDEGLFAQRALIGFIILMLVGAIGALQHNLYALRAAWAMHACLNFSEAVRSSASPEGAASR